MIITHFTYAEASKLIEQSGYIDFEGCNARRGWDTMSRKDRRTIYKLIGHHVWFTQNNRCKTASDDSIGYNFDSQQIGAVKWSEYKKRFKNSKVKWSMVEALDESASMMGDNSDDYWLCDKPVSISLQVNHMETAE
jgi:hypothetical protein